MVVIWKTSSVDFDFYYETNIVNLLAQTACSIENIHIECLFLISMAFKSYDISHLLKKKNIYV